MRAGGALRPRDRARACGGFGVRERPAIMAFGHSLSTCGWRAGNQAGGAVLPLHAETRLRERPGFSPALACSRCVPSVRPAVDPSEARARTRTHRQTKQMWKTLADLQKPQKYRPPLPPPPPSGSPRVHPSSTPLLPFQRLLCLLFQKRAHTHSISLLKHARAHAQTHGCMHACMHPCHMHKHMYACSHAYT